MSAVCKSCQAPIRWAITENGKRIPLDVEPVPGGNIALDSVGVAIYVGKRERNGKPELGYVSHFATCNFAQQHRKTTARKPREKAIQ